MPEGGVGGVKEDGGMGEGSCGGMEWVTVSAGMSFTMCADSAEKRGREEATFSIDDIT